MLYKGFSTFNRSKRFSVGDYEIVKQDLFNHFNIRKGEKLMNPNFGTMIWDMIFEPFTSEIKEAITDEVKLICSYDPRIVLEQCVVDQYEHGINLTLSVRFLATNEIDRLNMMFNRDSQSMTTA
jgi:phage baseplate assembly protein W